MPTTIEREKLVSAITVENRLIEVGKLVPENLNIVINNIDTFGLVWKGEWTETTAYKVNDTVRYDSNIYIATQDNTNKRPSENIAIWTVFIIDRIESTIFLYDPTENYSIGSVIFGADSQIYKANKAVPVESGDPTVNTNDWDILYDFNQIEINKQGISAESSARSGADNALGDRITAETNARESKDTELSNDITAEASTRSTQTQDNANTISNETTARMQEDSKLTSDISGEATLRKQEDDKLANDINIINDIIIPLWSGHYSYPQSKLVLGADDYCVYIANTAVPTNTPAPENNPQSPDGNDYWILQSKTNAIINVSFDSNNRTLQFTKQNSDLINLIIPTLMPAYVSVAFDDSSRQLSLTKSSGLIDSVIIPDEKTQAELTWMTLLIQGTRQTLDITTPIVIGADSYIVKKKVSYGTNTSGDAVYYYRIVGAETNTIKSDGFYIGTTDTSLGTVVSSAQRYR